MQGKPSVKIVTRSTTHFVFSLPSAMNYLPIISNCSAKPEWVRSAIFMRERSLIISRCILFIVQHDLTHLWLLILTILNWLCPIPPEYPSQHCVRSTSTSVMTTQLQARGSHSRAARAGKLFMKTHAWRWSKRKPRSGLVEARRWRCRPK